MPPQGAEKSPYKPRKGRKRGQGEKEKGTGNRESSNKGHKTGPNSPDTALNRFNIKNEVRRLYGCLWGENRRRKLDVKIRAQRATGQSSTPTVALTEEKAPPPERGQGLGRGM